MSIDYKPIEAEDTHPLRHKVLRPHQPLDQMRYPLDDAKGSFHVGAFSEGEIVGIASIYPESPNGDLQQGEWRIRGMAIDPALQGKGLGRQLVNECIGYAKSQGAQRIWCNARTKAIGFYQTLGFNTVGEEFEIEGIGPHYIAELKINQ